MTHAYMQTLLDALEKIGYVKLQLNECSIVGGDVVSWEEYIVTVPAPGEFGPMFTDRQTSAWKRTQRKSRYEEIEEAIDKHVRMCATMVV